MAGNTLPAVLSDIVGRGWTYPFQFDQRTGGVAKDQGTGEKQRLQRILNGLRQILGVKVGEMFMSRTFGSEINKLVFKPNDTSIHGIISFAVTQAIETWEKRIRLDFVDVQTDPDEPARVQIELHYTIRRTAVQGNLVYPLYLADAKRATAELGLTQ